MSRDMRYLFSGNEKGSGRRTYPDSKNLFAIMRNVKEMINRENSRGNALDSRKAKSLHYRATTWRRDARTGLYGKKQKNGVNKAEGAHPPAFRGRMKANGNFHRGKARGNSE